MSTPTPSTDTASAPDEQPIRVLAVDDDPMVLDLIRVMLGAAPDIRLVGTASDGDEVVEAVTRHRPDVVLMDVRMQRLGGIEACAEVTQRPGAPRVIILTTFDERDDVPRAMVAGAIGFILKSAAREELYNAIRGAYAGHSPMSAPSAAHLRSGYLRGNASIQHEARRLLESLSARELDVARAVARELTNTQIAKELYVSEGSVKQYLGAIQAKLGVASRVGIAMIVARAD